jgi:hypothetical protein
MATNKLPRIPAMPLGFVEARQILSRMGGREVPAEWRGGLNIKYRIGPGFQKGGKAKKLRIEVKSSLEVKLVKTAVCSLAAI